MHICKNDLVAVMAGNEAGKTGKVIKVLRENGRVVIKGVKIIHKHVKPTQSNPRGGRIEVEASIAVSSVLPVCQNKNCKKSGRGVRIKKKLMDNRGKLRVCVYCGSEIVSAE